MRPTLLLTAVAAVLILGGCIAFQGAPDGIPPDATEGLGTATMTGTVPLTGTATATGTVAPTGTVVPTGTAVVTGTETPTGTPVATGTATVTTTATVTATESPTGTVEPTGTATSMPGTMTPTPGTPAPGTPTSTPAQPSPSATPTKPPTPTFTPGPPPTSTPLPATVFIQHDRSFADGPNLYVVGEAVNGAPAAVYGVKIIATFYDNGNQLVGAQETYALLPQTWPRQPNPFKVMLPNAPANVSRYELAVTWDDFGLATYDRVTVVSEEVRDNNGVEIAGDIRNDHPGAIENIVVVATFYDDTGTVVDVYPGTVGQTSLPSGSQTNYAISTFMPDLEYDSYLVQTQGVLGR